MVNIIAAIGKNRELGKNNQLLWNIPEDLQRFKRLTTCHPVIMGRKTYESMGRLLPNRTNIIITRDENYKVNEALVAHSLEEAIKIAKQYDNEQIFVIGGGQIYEQALPLADKLYLTIVHQTYPEADTYFPDYSIFNRVISKQEGYLNNLRYTFIDLAK